MTDIAGYGLLSDCQGAALVSLTGSVDWWCPARFDAPSVFARLLDPQAGHWSIAPVGEHTATRRYLDGTMVVQTDFRTNGGQLRVTDALALGTGERGHRIGLGSPHQLLRQVEVLSGTVEVAVELVARPGYGLVTPTATRLDTGDVEQGCADEQGCAVELVGGGDRLVLTGDVPLVVADAAVTARFTRTAGDTVCFALRHQPIDAQPPDAQPIDADRPAGVAGLADTIAGWRSWDELHRGYQGPYLDQVRRSALVLQALTYQPTGAVVAAATTSLPEEVGGVANWDYRFGWLRDGAFTMQALWVAACPDEAYRFFDWIADSTGAPVDGPGLPAGQPVPVMFGVGGERDLTEHTLDHLAGYQDSRPVRVGNDAWRQRQLDVLGEVLNGAWIMRDHLAGVSPGTASFLRSLADRAAACWTEPDAGIWEGRDDGRHYVTSKLGCWVALDRAVRLAGQLDADPDTELSRWRQARDDVHAAILDQGWDADRQAFTGAFGSPNLDAGVLAMPMVGFLPGTDPRILSTIDVIERELSCDGLVQRWTDAGDEGAFLICSYWLAEAHALAGRPDRARRVFDRATSYANDLGLLSEEVHRRDGSLIGNFPQGLSHIGLINAAWTIAQAEQAGSQAAQAASQTTQTGSQAGQTGNGTAVSRSPANLSR
ncbi:glycoside hydrolase family 15 protein [Micromonospora sp. NBC_01813]|uniref:glycoside hydrolase family 15 protein n=1 Tax=Micromonospora sp. NBC_01813 TaxID=2975988 RepID=UPI003FA34B69